MQRSRISVTSFLMRESWRESTALATSLVALTATLGQLVVTDASANPQGGSIVAGEASIDTTAPDEVTVNQSSVRAVIEWDSFSIGEGEHTRFVQPNSNAVTLNRVTGSDLSEIAGKLTANGKVILVNPNGIMFTGTADVDVGSLIASTSDINNDDIIDETNNVLAFTSGPLNGSIINDGDVTVAEGGLAAFVAPYVRNNGNITARLGRVALGSGNIFTLDLNGDGLTKIALSDDVDVGIQGRSGSVDVTGNGLIAADGGLVVLSVSDASTLIDKTINMDGVIRARSVESRNGKVILGGPKALSVLRGDVDVSGQETGMVGGEVTLGGMGIILTDTAEVDASGSAGGGRIDIGKYEGVANPDLSPTVGVIVEKGATLDADANVNGSGGEILVTAEEAVLFYGRASAQGGAEGGDGGSIELVSGNRLGVSQARFDASTPSETAGQLRLEGSNILIADVESPNIDAEAEPASPETESSLESELTFLDDGTVLARDTIERTLDGGTSVAILASDRSGGDVLVGTQIASNSNRESRRSGGGILIGTDIEYDGDHDVQLVLEAKGDVSISGKIASKNDPLQVEVHADNSIVFESGGSAVDVAEDILAAIAGNSVLSSAKVEIPIPPRFPSLSDDGAIVTKGDVTLNAGHSIVGPYYAVESTDIEAPAIDITAKGIVSVRTKTSEISVANQGGSWASIDNVGNLKLVEFEAEDQTVDIYATGDIEAPSTIGTDDAPVYQLWVHADGNVKLNGAVSTVGQFLSGKSVSLAGSYRTNGGSFSVGDAYDGSSTVIDGTNGPVVVDTIDPDYNGGEETQYGSIAFQGTLDGTNRSADVLVLRVGEGNVTFKGDVGKNVSLGTLSIEGNATALPVVADNAKTNEDVPVAIAIKPPDNAFQSLSISGLPIGSKLDDGINPGVTIETADQVVDLEQFDLDSLRFGPTLNSDDDVNAHVTITVQGSNEVNLPASGVFNVASFVKEASAESNFTVEVNPIVDGTTIQTVESDWSGNRLPVQIDAALLDNDGSESVIILIDDLPEGTALSAGTANADGSFSLTLADLDSLELISANAGDSASALVISAITTEANDPDQTLTSASFTLAIPERPFPLPPPPPITPSDPQPTTSEIGSRIVLEGTSQQGPVGDALRPNRFPDASPIVTASSREDSPQDLEEPVDPFSVEPAAGEDDARAESWEACPDIVDASVSWQNTASDAAFNVNPNLVPYSVDVYCGGYHMTAAGRGVSEDYQDLSFVSRDFWTDLKQERTSSVIEELRPNRSTYSAR